VPLLLVDPKSAIALFPIAVGVWFFYLSATSMFGAKVQAEGNPPRGWQWRILAPLLSIVAAPFATGAVGILQLLPAGIALFCVMPTILRIDASKEAYFRFTERKRFGASSLKLYLLIFTAFALVASYAILTDAQAGTANDEPPGSSATPGV